LARGDFAAILAFGAALLHASSQRRMNKAMAERSPFSDTATAAAAWARFRRIMRWMFLVTATTVVGALTVLYRQEGMVSPHFYIAVAIGMSFAMLLMSALMGLVFLSSSGGHDDDAAAPHDEDQDLSR
jgi:hypothetical protein